MIKKKTITLYVCEICNQDDEDKSHLIKCDICGKNICHDCCIDYEFFWNDKCHLVICSNCSDGEKMRKFTKEFYEKSKQGKELIKQIKEDYFQFIKLRIIGDKL